MTTTTLKKNLLDLIQRALEEPEGIPVSLEIPRIRAHGDFSTSVALQLASRKKRPPLEIAQKVAQRLKALLQSSPLHSDIEEVEVKPPGFINILLSPTFLYKVLKEVLKAGSSHGRCTLGQGRKAMVEFVSANPTGPLSVAHGRQAAVGDALANLLSFVGYRVSREYYVNDEGTQIDLLGASILARAREQLGLPSEFPENGYQGMYILETAQQLLKRKGSRAMEGPKALELARAFGIRELTDCIRRQLKDFGIRFDRWFPQSSLRRFGYLHRSLARLKKRRYLYPSEGAWWLKSTAFGDDKDRVVIRSDGRETYIATDIAYHRLKFKRGFRLLVNLWGPDHHGYIPRLKAAVQALGLSPDTLQIRIVQLCTLKRGAEAIPMSTRQGQFITLTQVVEEVGKDAARFFFLLRKTDAHLEFDLELAKRHSLENPVYYIQYAHARIANILEFQKRHRQRGSARRGRPDYALLTAPEELTLLRLLREFPGVVEMAAKSLEPFGVVAFLQELAEALHRFYDTHRVVSPDLSLTTARLDLCRAVKIVLATGLKLLGVSAPTQM